MLIVYSILFFLNLWASETPLWINIWLSGLPHANSEARAKLRLTENETDLQVEAGTFVTQ